jgi:acetyl esterase
VELDYNRIDPELLPLLDVFPPLEVSREGLAQVREVIAESRDVVKPDGLIEEVRSLITKDAEVPLYVYRKSHRANQPALLWIHGGGYVMGSPEDQRAIDFAYEGDITVVSVDYRLAPEHPFPAGLNDCYEALCWMIDNAEELGIDPGRLAIGGASAGGGLAAGLALKNRAEANHPLCFQLLLYPMIDNLHDTESGQITNHPIWTRASSFNAWEMYLNGEPGLDASPYAAASRADDLSGLPPAYICVGVEDLFRDEDIDYAKRLMAAAVPCELAIFPGVFHAAEVFLPDTVISRRMNRSITRALFDALIEGSSEPHA